MARIRLQDYPNIRFNRDGVERFLKRFEEAADCEGAMDLDKPKQVIYFIEQEEDLRGVEDMDVYLIWNWTVLKQQIIKQWGRTEPEYRDGDLEVLANKIAASSGITSREEFCCYHFTFSSIYCYLRKKKYILAKTNVIFQTFLCALAPKVQEVFIWKLYNFGKTV